MSGIESLSATHADFTLETNTDDRRLVVVARGEAEMKSVDKLSDFLNTLHHEALQRGVEMVVFDMQHLRFLNSGCFKLLVNWIGIVARADPQYRITFIGNRAVAWQKRSLGALRCVDEKIVTIEGLETEPA